MPRTAKTTLTKAMLPPHVRDYVPDDLPDADLPLWYVAFETGRSAQGYQKPLMAHPASAPPDLPITTETNYGDPVDTVEDMTGQLLGYVSTKYPMIDLDVMGRVIQEDSNLSKWVSGTTLPSGRVMDGVIEELVAKLPKLIKSKNGTP